MPTISSPSQYAGFTLVAQDLDLKASEFSKKQAQINKAPSLLNRIRNYFRPQSNTLISLGKRCESLLDKVERTPTLFTANESQTLEQNQSYAACLKTAKTVVSMLSASKSPQIKASLNSLMQRVAALQYRIEGANGGLDRSAIDPALTEKLCAAAQEWKNKYPLIAKKELSAQEITKLEKASTYPEFCTVLLSGDKRLKEAFFNWALRENNDVSLFIEFPATWARIKSSYLSSRIGELGVQALQNRVQKENAPKGLMEKNIILPFFNGAGTDNISILDESREVGLNDGLNITINKILTVLSRKNHEVGDLEMFRHGIMNWNCHQLGSLNSATGGYDRIDLTDENWLKKLPVLKEITHTDLEERVGEKLKAGEWVVFAKASRTTADLDLDGRHGYFELAVPTGDGKYGLYPFGIFPPSFPISVVELLKFLGNTFRAKISYPDENFFYAHRQQAEYPMRLSDQEVRDFMKVLQKELIKSRYGHLIFQFGAENCAYWSQCVLNTIEAKKHNFYKTDYVESYPLNPLMKNIFAFFRSLPKLIRNSAIRNVDAMFGTRRGIYVFENRQRVFKSHKTSPVRNEFVIYQPGHLHQQILKGEIKGRVYLGAC